VRADGAAEELASLFRLSGTLELRTYGTAGRNLVAGFAVLDARRRTGQNGDLGPWTAVPALSVEVLASLAPTGRVVATAFPEGIDGATRDVWRALLARWQVVGPDRPTDAAWTTLEEDTTGTYEASYVRAATDPATIHKRKTTYARMAERALDVSEWRIDLAAEASPGASTCSGAGSDGSSCRWASLGAPTSRAAERGRPAYDGDGAASAARTSRKRR
jgi:hypothetical protein